MLQNIKTEGDRSFADEIYIIREIPWDEVERIVNAEKNHPDDENGDECDSEGINIGEYNTGRYNTGDLNVGNRNQGTCNVGDMNRGHENVGNCNRGNFNTGNKNNGSWNTGESNTGGFNTEMEIKEWGIVETGMLEATISETGTRLLIQPVLLIQRCQKSHYSINLPI